MPSLENIRQFNHRLVPLGNEPEVVSGWGEELEEVDEPDSGLDSDLSSLLSDTEELSDDEAASADQAEDVPDFEQLLAADAAEEQAPPIDDFFDAADVGADDTLADAFSADDAIFDAPGDDGLTDTFPADDVSSDEPAEQDVDTDDSFTGAELGDLGEFALPGDEQDGVDDTEQFQDEFDSFELPDEFADPTGGDEPAEIEETLPSFDEPAFAEPEPGLTEPESTEPDSGDEFDLSGLDDEFDVSGFDAEEPVDLEAADEIAPDESVPESSFSEEDFTFTDEAPPDTGSSDDDIEDLSEVTLEGPDVETEDTGFDADPTEFEFTDEDVTPESPADTEEFSFDEPDLMGGTDDFDMGASDDLGDIADDIDEFSLGDFGAEFGVVDDDGPSEEDLNPAIGVPEVSPGIPAATPAAFHISDADFVALQTTLAQLPLNLRADVQEIVAEAKGTTDQVEKLIHMLVAGEPATDIALAAGRILGKTIKIPRGYEKRSGARFERERDSFAYQFRENVLPILRVVGIFAVGITAVGLAGYHLVFKPLYARSLYQAGLTEIANDQYTLGNQTFDRAWEVRTVPKWYYDYAGAFVQKRQYALAAQKYRQLLFTRDPLGQAKAQELLEQGKYGEVIYNFEPETRGVLEFARLESELLGNYPQAERLLQIVLVADTSHYQARLTSGNNYMRWAEEDPQRFEQARLEYARLLDRYGHTDELLFRMLRYFIATDNLEEVVRLAQLFQGDSRAQVEPDAYALLAGYLIDYGLLQDVEDILFRALEIEGDLPELHYELARLYREIDAPGSEELALGAAVDLLENADPLSPRRRGMLVDAHIRVAENLYDKEEFFAAQEHLTQGISAYETGLRQRALRVSAEYGRGYALLADIFFYQGRQYDDALLYYDQAESNGYDEPNLDYKQGFVHYRNKQYEAALREFRESENDPSGVTNALIWAIANTYYRRQNYHAAEAYYREIVERAENQRDSVRTLLLEEDPSHQAIITYMIRGYNNLGIALNRLYAETQEPDRYSEGLFYLVRSTELAENYRRDPDTLSRSESVDLAFLNNREILYPRPEYELQIYGDLPEDLDDLLF